MILIEPPCQSYWGSYFTPYFTDGEAEEEKRRKLAQTVHLLSSGAGV